MNSTLKQAIALINNDYTHVLEFGVFKGSTIKQLRDLLPTLIMAVIMASVTYFLYFQLIDYVLMVQLIVPLLFGFLAYIFMSKITNNTSFINAITLIDKQYFR